VYETKIYDIDDMWKFSIQTWFDFDQDIIDTVIDQCRDWGHVRVLVMDTLNTYSNTNVHLCDSSEYFVKLSM